MTTEKVDRWIYDPLQAHTLLEKKHQYDSMRGQ
jgi:hypothetical protein